MATLAAISDVFTAHNNFSESIIKCEGVLTSDAMDLGLYQAFKASQLGFDSALQHRRLLKKGARCHKVGDNTKAEFYRKQAQLFGNSASAQLRGASAPVNDLVKNLGNLRIGNISLGDKVRKNVGKPQEWKKTRDDVLNATVKPYLVDSDLSPNEVGRIWKDINEFLDKFDMNLPTEGSNVFPNFPDLVEAAKDLDDVDYTKPEWDYADPIKEGKGQSLPGWKEKLVEVGRWVTLVVGVLMAVITCNLPILYETIEMWMNVEDTVRTFCGWSA